MASTIMKPDVNLKYIYIIHQVTDPVPSIIMKTKCVHEVQIYIISGNDTMPSITSTISTACVPEVQINNTSGADPMYYK